MHTTNLTIRFAGLVLLLATATTSAGRIIYVDDDAPGANNGSSWVDAYKYLQDAIADAKSSEKPVQMCVAQGMYKPDQGNEITPGDRAASFQLLNGVTLKGGYAGFGKPDPNARDTDKYETILSGDLSGNDVALDDPCDLLTDPVRAENSYHVVFGGGDDDAGSVLDGFTVTGGNADRHTYDTAHGGGVWYGKPTISHCKVVANSAVGAGGGICLAYGGSVTDSTIAGNCASFSGALSACDRIANCIVTGNCATEYYGGAMAMCYEPGPLIADCTFADNKACLEGGALHIFQASPTVVRCAFINNSAATVGGAVAINGCSTCGDCFPEFNRCGFINNWAAKGGGLSTTGEATPTLNACLFVANRATDHGAALYIWGISWVENNLNIMTNCTFTGNRAPYGSAIACDSWEQKSPSDVEIINSIFWNGPYQIWNNDASSIRITYSDVQGGWTGAGNTNVDPCFAELGRWDSNGTPDETDDDFWVDGDYHPKSEAGRWDANEGRWTRDEVTSLCIDSGDPFSPIGYEPFPNGGRINMGAYGGTLEASKSYFGGPPCETIVAGDVNGDCIVDFKDFAIMALHWLEHNQP